MGWEERSGKHYYYRKRREGSSVVSEYVGRGKAAELVAELEQRRRLERERRQERFKREKEHHRKERQQVDEVRELIRAFERAVLLLNGYHTHKGQWRKRHEGQV